MLDAEPDPSAKFHSDSKKSQLNSFENFLFLKILLIFIRKTLSSLNSDGYKI